MSWATCFTAAAPHAHLVKGYLEHRGVPCVLLGNGPEVVPVPTFGMQVLVPEEWLPVVKKMLSDPPRPQRRTSTLLKRVH